jgi:hypothetical protein
MSNWSNDSWSNFHVFAGCTSSTIKIWDPTTSASANLVTPSASLPPSNKQLNSRRTICWTANAKVLAYAGNFPFVVLHSGQQECIGCLPNGDRKAPWPTSVGINKLRFVCGSLYMLACSDDGSVHVLNCKDQVTLASSSLQWPWPFPYSICTSISLARFSAHFAGSDATGLS